MNIEIDPKGLQGQGQEQGGQNNITDLQELIVKNDAVIRMIDSDPELRKRYETDMQAKQANRTTTQALFAELFDTEGIGLTADDGIYRRLDTPHVNGVTYRMLRAAGRTEVPRLIKQTRRLQLPQFALPARARRFGKEVGFRFAWDDPDYRPTMGERIDIAQWEQRVPNFFYTAGSLRPNFVSFLGNAYEDFFDLDDITVTIRRDGMNKPFAMSLEDPSRWYHIVPKVNRHPRHFDRDVIQGLMEPGAIQDPDYQYALVDENGKTLAKTTEDYTLKAHFITRSDFPTWRRGYSIMEQAVRITGMILNAMTMNASNFTNDRIPPGMLILPGFQNQIMLEKLKKVMWAYLQGAQNKHRLPIVGLPADAKAQYIAFHESAKDMEFHTFMTLLSTFLFSLSGTSPNEAYLASFQDALKGSRLNEESNDGIFRRSQDTGLNSFVMHLETQVLNPKNSQGDGLWYEVTGHRVHLILEGLASEQYKARLEADKIRLETTASVNQLKREAGEDQVKYEMEGVNIYDVPAVNNPMVNRLIAQDLQTKAQQRMQEEQQQAMAAQQPGGEQYSPQDQELIQKYGPPQPHEAEGAEGQEER